jgi:cardiolipin synthase
VGSSNLNLASWIGNYELDCVVENDAFAAEMEDLYLADLENATEIVLEPRRRRQADREPGAHGPADRAAATHGESDREPVARGQPDREPGGRESVVAIRPGGSASRAAAGALRVGRTVTAALSQQRVLARTDARLVASSGMALLAIAVVGVIWPLAIIVPLAIVLAWVAFVLLARAFTLRRERRSQGLPATRVRPATSPPRVRS